MHVVSVFAGSPAEDAGVKTNWFLISVDGTNLVSGSSDQCGSMVRGRVGTSVTVELADPKRHQTNSFTIKRADVRTPENIEEILREMFKPGTVTTNAPAPFLIAQ